MRLPASLLHALAFSACCNGAAGTPALTGEDFAKVAKLAADILTEQHFSRRSPDDALSREWLRSYFERVDPGRKWFLRKDVADLEKRFGTVLDDALLAGDAAPATALYAKLLDRVRERRKWIDGFLRDEGADTFAFLGDDTSPRPGTIKNWAGDRAAADEVWRRRVLAEVLAVKLQEDTTLAAARDRVRKRYRRQVKRLIAADSEAVFDHYLTALVRCYDSRCDYFSSKDLDRFTFWGRRPVGIGALLKMGESGFRVEGIIRGGPAEKAGTRIGDHIVDIAQGDTGEFLDLVHGDFDEILEQISGRPGTTLRLKITPAATPDPAFLRQVVLQRSEVPIGEQRARAAVIEIGADRIAWLEPRNFYRSMNESDSTSASRDLAAMIKHLEEEDLQGLVLDLRQCWRGSHVEAANIVSQFVGSRIAVRVRKSAEAGDEDEQSFRGDQAEAIYTGPLAVLVDAETAGAAEHVAGALQDYGRALVVGDSSTSGQGLLQAFEPLRGKEFRQRAGALRITIGKFYRPSGRAIQSKGVDPDVLLPWGNPSLSRKSAQYNPLPYDEIRGHADFKPTARPKLRVLPPGESNPERATLQNKLAEMRSRTELSLSEKRRRSELTQIDEMLARLDELAAERPIVTIKKHLTVSQEGDVIETMPAAEAASGWIRSQEGVRAAAQILLATETSQP